MITFKSKSTQMTYIPEIQQQMRSVQDKSSLIFFNEKRRKALK